ncbi:MAG: hypothetical protein LBU83_01030 [Bacteroidales bacterium]|jgi:HEAT repeat protein|nr:hypothetical protein [Bacteroidales bacterium]
MKVTSYKLRLVILTLLFSCFLAVLEAQTLDYNYHPYEYAQEELFLTSFGIKKIYVSDDCDRVRDVINNYYDAAASGEDNEKYKYLRMASYFQCEEAFNFLEMQIKKNPNETDRCNAIMFLAWMLNPDYLHSILEYAAKDTLSIQEKAAIATAFMFFGIYNAKLDLKEQSIKMLDEICEDASPLILGSCILNYFSLRGEIAISFFTTQLKQEEFKLYAALFLAQLGEHKHAFPILVEALSSEDTYEVHLAVMGLEAIDTGEAYQLIRNLPPNKNRYALKRPQIHFDLNEIKKGDKL